MAIKPVGQGDLENEGAIVAEINITPLTDIFLVLLIIFMVTSSVMSQSGVEVNLPKSSSASSLAQPEGVIVTLLPGGRLRVNQNELGPGKMLELERILKACFARSRSRLVILEGDRQAFLGSAIEIMDHARIAGAEKFAIATTVESESKK